MDVLVLFGAFFGHFWRIFRKFNYIFWDSLGCFEILGDSLGSMDVVVVFWLDFYGFSLISLGFFGILANF